MNLPALRLFRDFVDPASYLVERFLETVDRTIRPLPYEIRHPSAPLIDPRLPEWRRYREAMRTEAAERGITFRPPQIVPWSRKAHELSIHGHGAGIGTELDRALYRAYFEEGRDIGRVDVLVEVAEDLGLDRTETKAVLDVDRHDGEVERIRSEARELGVRGAPTLLAGSRRLEGFRPDRDIRTFLQRTLET